MPTQDARPPVVPTAVLDDLRARLNRFRAVAMPHELLRKAGALLIDATIDRRLEGVIGGRSDRLTYVSDSTDPHRESLLVRPDGYVAWSGDDPSGAAIAVERWFGPDEG